MTKKRKRFSKAPEKSNSSGRSRRQNSPEKVPIFHVRTRRHQRSDSKDRSFRDGNPRHVINTPTVSLLIEQVAPLITIDIDGRARRLIVDMGSDVSILQPGVSSSQIKDSALKPFGVTGSP